MSKMCSHDPICLCVYADKYILYNGIFSRRQIFAVLSKKHGDYFSRLAMSAKNNFDSFLQKS